MQRSFTLQPGFNNLVAISALHYSATDDLKLLAPEFRNCYFPDEINEVKLFKNYSSSNCLLNCWLTQVGLNLSSIGFNCMPLQLFLVNPENLNLCDPFQTAIFWNTFNKVKLDDNCDNCLPDCTHISYQHTVSLEPFRSCDEKNFGISKLCNFNNPDQIVPIFFGSSELYTAAAKFGFYDLSITELAYASDQRPQTLIDSNFDTYLFGTKYYDPYSKDIAIASFYFHSSTIIEFRNSLSQTWLVFLANVAGIFGLFIGITLMTIFELLWLMRIFFEN